MANILKLQNAGDVATLNITGCEVVEGNYGQQVKFEAGDDTLYLPDTSAFRQLERIGLDVESAVGKRLVFSRTASTKPGAKPFWDIAVAKKANGKPPVSKNTSSKPNAELPEFLQNQEEEDAAELHSKIGPAPTEKPKMREAYKALTEWVLTDIAPLYKKAQIGMSPESAAACVQTLFIQASQRGKIE